ncbi:hypothetical protein SUGI_0025570 [Cryptomeria japonica]|nr:hypothetical protein SUGI_0025570 [Cryptomeria japonica]
MAAIFGLISSRGYLWLQLAIFVWQAIRPAATMRLPWALLGSGVHKILRRKRFDKDHFILLSTDYNDTADSHLYCEKYKGSLNRDFSEIDLGGSSKFWYNNCHYIADREKASQVRLLIIGELKNVPIVKEYKVVNGFVGIWVLCSADEAIRMCLASKRFRLSFRKIVSFCLIEHMPLTTDTYWLTKVLGGVPLYLTATGNEELSSVMTLLLIVLDFTYNLWSPIVEMAYLVLVRFVQLLLSKLPPNLRFLVFYLLSNFDNRYLPCSISDFKVKIERTKVFYTTDNTVLNCPVRSNGISQEYFGEDDITPEIFQFKTSAFNVVITKSKQSNDELIEFELMLQGVLYDLVKASYTMTHHNFQTYIGCWRLLEKGCIGLVETVGKGMLISNMHLFGFEETINLFWGSKVNVYKVEVEEEFFYLIAGDNHKHFMPIKLITAESPLYLAIARRWVYGGSAPKHATAASCLQHKDG